MIVPSGSGAPLNSSASVLPETVGALPSISPGTLLISFRIAMMPPTRLPSSTMWYWTDGESLQMFGVRAEISSSFFRSSFVPASVATARVCNTVFEEPPIAMSSTSAFWNAAGVAKSFAVGGFSILASSTARRAARFQSSTRSGESAAMVPLPGSAMPSASHRQFMLFAVNMPEQEPGLPIRFAATPSKIEIRSVSGPPSACGFPARIGPPEAKMVGMFSRIAPISMPGTTLSQFGMQIIASNGWAVPMVSTLSAMISRLAREYFIPLWPIAMPSQTAMVLNS